MKPRSKEELIQGRVLFWETFDFQSVIDASIVAEVFPIVIDCEGGPRNPWPVCTLVELPLVVKACFVVSSIL